MKAPWRTLMSMLGHEPAAPDSTSHIPPEERPALDKGAAVARRAVSAVGHSNEAVDRFWAEMRRADGALQGKRRGRG